MNGRDFLVTAEQLASSRMPADLRSAISRDYYAAFHVVKDYFERCGIHFSIHSPDAHTKMPMCLINTNVAEAVRIGGLLITLRRGRVEADYRLDREFLEKAGDETKFIEIADMILESVDRLATEPNIARILRPKAVQLGLRVEPV